MDDRFGGNGFHRAYEFEDHQELLCIVTADQLCTSVAATPKILIDQFRSVNVKSQARSGKWNKYHERYGSTSRF
jgi:hypothetical protein